MSDILYTDATFDKLVSLVSDLYRFTKTFQKKRQASKSWQRHSDFSYLHGRNRRFVEPELFYCYKNYNEELNYYETLEIVSYRKKYSIHCELGDWRPRNLSPASSVHALAHLYGEFDDLPSAVMAFNQCLDMWLSRKDYPLFLY